MPNIINNTDVYTIINAVAREMFGENSQLQVVNTTSFLTIGETIMRAGQEKLYNALSMVIGRTIVDVRRYNRAFKLITRSDMEYGNIIRIISYYTKDISEATTSDNTTSPSGTLSTPLFDGQNVDHYKINKVYPLDLKFYGTKSIQKHFTTFEGQAKSAFHSEQEFAKFVAGIATEMANEIDYINESETVTTVLGYIGALYQSDMPRMKVNILDEFNKSVTPNTSYTIADVTVGAQQKAFYEFFVVYYKSLIKMLARPSVMYHQTPEKNDELGNPLSLLRFTPKSAIRVLMYEPLFMNAQAKVLPEIFNNDYLQPDSYEGVMYWQNPDNPSKVHVKASRFDSTDGTSKGAVDVEIPYVVGIVFDEKALGINFQMERTVTTPVNAAGLYYNTYYHWRKNYLANLTQNGVLLYMENPTT